MKKETKGTSIDRLARMVQKGFEETATRTDVARLEERIENVGKEVVQMREEIFKQHSYRLRALEAEIRSIKEQMLLK